MPTISVILPCYNEEKFIGLILDDLAKQTHPPDQVIVSDGHSEDKTIAVAKSFAKRLPIEIAHATVRTPGGGRNAGAELATGEYFMFIDADTRIPPHFIQMIHDELSARPVDYVTPKWRSNGKLFSERLLVAVCNAYQWWGAHVTHKPWGIGPVMTVSANAYHKLGGFTEARWAHEDNEFTDRLGGIKASFTYLPALVAIYSDRSTRTDGALSTFLKSNFRGDSWAGRHIAVPVAKLFGKTIRYGDYDRQ